MSKILCFLVLFVVAVICQQVPIPGLASIPSNFNISEYIGTGGTIPPSGKPDVVGAFRFICNAAHLAYDDPVVFPGQPGASHLHQFYGNTEANAHSTYESLRKTGNSTCQNILNRSSYWMPAMMNGKGGVVRPDYISIYYKRRPKTDPYCQVQGKECVDVPRGLKMVVGYDLKNFVKGSVVGYFNCDGPTAKPDHYPDIVTAAKNCPVGNNLGAVIGTPDCWDGKNLDSPNHQDHMSVGSYGSWGYYKCPDTHPYVIPAFTLAAWYKVDEDLDKSGKWNPSLPTWHLSSDILVNGTMVTPGLTFHADWFGAWDDTVMKTWHDNCIDKLLNCAAGELGDGTGMKMYDGFSWAANPRVVPVPPRPPVIIKGSFSCSCLTGSTGEGRNCSNVDECKNGNCNTQALCSETNGNYECTCPGGSIGNGCTCTDIDECAINNGGCDKVVSCKNTLGNRTCGECPFGYYGSGYTSCTRRCGNGVCDIEYEDCVSCPLDCGGDDTTCDKCGDGKCDSTIGEDCSSCYEDCRSLCIPQNCPSCSAAHGTCISGTCVCSGNRTGHNCDEQQIPVVVVVNATVPSVIIRPELPPSASPIQKTVLFDVSVRNLVERNERGEIQDKIELGTMLNFTFADDRLTVGSSNLIWVFTSTLRNKANVTITFIQFLAPSTNYTYFNQTMIFSANTLKLNVKVENWPFKSISNSLDVEMENVVDSKDGVNACGVSTQKDEDGMGYLQWIKIKVNGVSVFARYVPDSFIDGRKRNTNFKSVGSTTVAATFPHFWASAEFDPNFSVLVDPITDDCDNPIVSGSDLSSGAIVGITVGVAAGVASATIASFFIMKAKNKKDLEHRLSGPLKSMTTSSKSLSDSQNSV